MFFTSFVGLSRYVEFNFNRWNILRDIQDYPTNFNNIDILSHIGHH